MTKKQWAILVIALAVTLYSLSSGSGKDERKSEKISRQESGSLSSSTIIAEADAALLKMADIAGEGGNIQHSGSVSVPTEPAPNADDILKSSNLNISQENTVSSSPMQAANTVTSEVMQDMVVPTPTEMKDDLNQINDPIVRSQFERERTNFRGKEQELLDQLNLAKNENIKLLHEVQSLELVIADSKRSDIQQKESDLKLKSLQTKLKDTQDTVGRAKSETGELERRLEEEGKLRKSAETQLQEALKKRDDQMHENDKLRRNAGELEKRIKSLEEQNLAAGEEKEKVVLKQLATLRKDFATAQTASEDLKKKNRTLEGDLSSAKKNSEDLQAQLIERKKQNEELINKLNSSEQLNEKSKDLEQELAALRYELLNEQEKVKTLLSTSKNLSTANSSGSGNYSGKSFQPQAARNQQQQQRPASQNDYVTIEVTAAKAVLRAGPGEEHSPVMEIQQGSRLMVETREGDWYRVITPKGQRAFLRSDLAVELDASGRPRYSAPPVRQVSPSSQKGEKAPPPPPSSDPLKELLGKVLKGDGDAPAAPSTNEEDEKSAFEALKSLKK